MKIFPSVISSPYIFITALSRFNSFLNCIEFRVIPKESNGFAKAVKRNSPKEPPALKEQRVLCGADDRS